eukprot:3399084-Alexandrium_andersonii.AAC.1
MVVFVWSSRFVGSRLLILQCVFDGQDPECKEALSETYGTAPGRHRGGTANAEAASPCGDSNPLSIY